VHLVAVVMVMVGDYHRVLWRSGEWLVWCDSWNMVDDGFLLYLTCTGVRMMPKHKYACY